MKFVTALIVFILWFWSSAKASDGSVCFANQELSFFCDAKLFQGAKKSCADKDSYLVKIDSANMTEVVNTLIDSVKCRYPDDIFIGANAIHHPDFPTDRSKRIWEWWDGSKVFLPVEVGYQNWQAGQPNDFGNQEDCLVIGKYTKQWKDFICLGYQPEPKYYICQKSATMKLEVSSTLNEIRCETAIGSCRTLIEWRRDSSIVSYDRSEDVYQISNLTSSTLHYKNATIGDAGKYECVGWIDDKTNSKSIAVEIPVNGIPEVIDIRSSKCNTSLQIVWKPQLQSLGYLHRLEARASISGKLKKVVEVTPTKAVLHFIDVTELKPSTEYEIKVVACKDVKNCSDKFAAMKSATTSPGIIYRVTNSTIQQNIDASDLPTCVVSWQWIHNMTDTFRITSYYNPSETLNLSIVEQTILTQNNFYFFAPFSGRQYDVEIQPVMNENYCSKPVKAIGACIGKSEELASTLVQNYISAVVAMGVAIFILSVVIFSMALRMHMRSTESLQAPMQEPGNVNDYATVRNPEINEAAYSDLSDNTAAETITSASTGNFLYENIAQNLSPTYETVKNMTTLEYEM